MRTESQRTEKYSKKAGGLVLPGQKKNFAAKINRQVEIEHIVNRIAGSTINRVYYIIFGKEANALIEKHKGGIADAEMEILQDKWTARGLSIATLEAIERAIGYTVPITGLFRLDASALDGTDVLA